METETSMIFNVLIKRDDDIFVAHCLELDIVATAKTMNEAKTDMMDLIMAQVDFAFSNDNLDYLYHPAPSEIWQEFYACKEQIEKKVDIKSSFKHAVNKFIPPWFIARTCIASGLQACSV